MTVLVLGSSGQVATHLREIMPQATFWGRRTFDLAEPAGLFAAIRAAAPSVIVNAAAYTAVDKAESEPDLAWRLNTDAPAQAARAATALDIPLVHLSTDYVFDGRKPESYRVADPVGPINVYGATKLGGELAVRALCPKHWIVRTSWVFSEHGANFVKTMLRLAAGNTALRVVGDQHGKPTYAGDVAALIATLARGDPPVPYGTLHAVGGPATTWHGFAETIFAEAHDSGLLPRRPSVARIVTAGYPTPAKRPLNSVLEASEGLPIALNWEMGLSQTLRRLKG